MATTWHHQVECSRPDYRRRLLAAWVIFGALLLVPFLVSFHLYSHNLSGSYIRRTLASYREDMKQTARRLEEILAREGKYDLFTLKENLTTFTRDLNDRMAQRVAIRRISLYDVNGRMVSSMARTGWGFVPRPTTLDGLPGRQPVLTGKGELPDQPPPLSTPQPPDGSQYGPPAPRMFRLGSAVRETFIVVPVTPASADAPPAGYVQLGVDEQMLESEVAQLQKVLMKRLAGLGFLFLVVLVTGFLYVLRLLQKTRRLEAEAQMADRLAYVGTLASGLAHEIRNPLNAMNMNLQMIEEELPCRQAPEEGRRPADTEDTRALLESTKGEIKRLERLVSNFLAYARPAPLNPEERDLNATLDDVVRFLRADLASKGIDVETRLAPGLPPVEMDESQIKQALMNILINAREVLGQGGRIEVATDHGADRTLEIRVSDNGPGIPPGKIDKVFQAFYSTRSGGSGLGLPIAQRIVENHGGRIEVESELGKGTTFRILLPRRQRPQPLAAPAAEPARLG